MIMCDMSYVIMTFSVIVSSSVQLRETADCDALLTGKPVLNGATDGPRGDDAYTIIATELVHKPVQVQRRPLIHTYHLPSLDKG